MAKSNFIRVMRHVFTWEGDFVNHAKDPGGATNRGITIRTLSAWFGRPATVDDVRALTEDTATAIYRERYWNPIHGDHLPYGLDYVAMDGAVNSGVRRGVQWLQAAIGVKADGAVGPKTIDAARRAPRTAIAKACALRVGFMRGLRHWGTFGVGWSRRVAHVEATATTMWLTAAHGVPTAKKTLQTIKDKVPKQVAAVRNAGTTQAGAVSAAGASGAATIPSGFWNSTTVAVAALSAVVLIALLALRTTHQMRYQREREAAYAAVLKDLT
jgi:lysozyme family protein